jgi:hypothetical protein
MPTLTLRNFHLWVWGSPQVTNEKQIATLHLKRRHGNIVQADTQAGVSACNPTASISPQIFIVDKMPGKYRMNPITIHCKWIFQIHFKEKELKYGKVWIRNSQITSQSPSKETSNNGFAQNHKFSVEVQKAREINSQQINPLEVLIKTFRTGFSNFYFPSFSLVIVNLYVSKLCPCQFPLRYWPDKFV